MSGIFLVAAKRTPFGAFGGSLKHLSATDLGVHSTQAALQSANLDPSKVDSVFFGNVIQSSPDAAYLSRHVGLRSGVDQTTPCLTINRLCGSGFETVILGAQSIALGESKITVCGGTENMSDAPLVAAGNDARWGVKLSKGLSLRDSLWDGLTDSYAGTPMGITAENLAKKYGISKQECDEFSLQSQQRWAAAQEAGVFDAEMAPIEVKTRKGMNTVAMDEHPRPSTTLEQLQKLRPTFDKEGVVTAGSASGICDGAGTVVLSSEASLGDMQPLCRLVSYAVVGCDPSIMGIGPVPAIQQALAKAGKTIQDVDRFEINEAFAAQFLACAKELDLDMAKTNTHGGAISIGHPLGASGSRITAHLANEFAQDPSVNLSVGAACIGGGQGIALVLERV
ncbi:unnamed protein product [Cylindrotheca closterium]|uniref:Uncharacterized protein n=1 Tax=Cylindrotheca closterium TaxID=2856 RepID=A0AAD2JHU5_9STRA|nr:unnamed protein product [Cylindrotheca closterium]